MTIPAITQSQTPTTPTPPQRPEPPRAMFSALAIAASGLSAQRVRMDVVAQNLANAETTKTPEGGPYRRRVVTLEAVTPESSFSSTIDASAAGGSGAAGAGGIAGSTPIEMTNDVG